MSNLAFTKRESRGLLLLAHGRRAPTDNEWECYLQALLAWTGQRDGDPPKQLVYSLGGGPNSQQRLRAFDTLPAEKLIAAVMTQSVVVRSIARVAAWTGVRARTFDLDSFGDAAKFLGISANDVEWLREDVDRLVRSLD